MDSDILDILQKWVIIIGGVFQMIYVMWAIIKDSRKRKDDDSQRGDTNPLPPLGNTITKLILAAGVVSFLYGATIFAFASLKTESAMELCLRGKDQHSYRVIQLCDQQVNFQYTKAAKPGLITIGIGFSLIAVAFFMRNFKTARWTEFAVEIMLFIFGIWLIITNL